jgi:hypothetical protein
VAFEESPMTVRWHRGTSIRVNIHKRDDYGTGPVGLQRVDPAGDGSLIRVGGPANKPYDLRERSGEHDRSSLGIPSR